MWGTFVGSAVAAKWGKLHYRILKIEKNRALAIKSGDFDAKILLKSGIRDIKWWLSNECSLPVVFKTRQPDVKSFSDASRNGWGCHTGDITAGGRWAVGEQAFHINLLELKACWLALQAFLKDATNMHDYTYMDNTCAIAYVNNFWGKLRN